MQTLLLATTKADVASTATKPSSDGTGIWIYFIAPPLGAALAWLIHSRVVAPAPEAPAAPVAEVLAEDTERGR